MLERLGQYAEKLCFPHQQARDKVFDAPSRKLDGTGEMQIFVEIQEIFGRDVQAVVEEMVVVVLTEVARSGIPPGGTTPLAIVLEKPHDVPCAGRVLIKPNARKALLQNEMSSNIARIIPESSAACFIGCRAQCSEVRGGWHIMLKAPKNLDLALGEFWWLHQTAIPTIQRQMLFVVVSLSDAMTMSCSVHLGFELL
ncbi:hypothetical protein, conserved [Eimeria tenella]|uniref:Uncharacterized protein n=1 Tax=Eimeria tenella TaxID=5802 RepID=U6KQA0_EIMTE|nr:hypothetical protein, conserved [Eimeria tenella]CDJ40302.1 hypothetical protein, conserved [Eimeria tenella]|eukprot:XP_013231055.1 hypothetical protein, conserved [Eimeria tenella]